MAKTLYLMRHGQTLFNVQNKNQGVCDGPLTVAGVAQARAAGRMLAERGITPSHVFSSTSERACDTCELVTAQISADGKPLPYERLRGVKELDLGIYEAKDGYLNGPSPFGDHFVQFGGESQDHLIERMCATLTAIMERPDVTAPLVVSHGAACANFWRHWGETSRLTFKKGIKNCTVFIYEFDEKAKAFSCVDYFAPEVGELPDGAHVDFSCMEGCELAPATPAGYLAPLDWDPAAPRELWLVRHAETLFNDQQKTQGWCDSPLTARGIEQARIIGTELAARGVRPDLAFCSTAERTSHTLELMLEELGMPGLPYQRLKGIREVGFGAFEAKDSYLEPREGREEFFVPFGGEATSAVQDRMVKTLYNAMSLPGARTVLAVSHGGACMNFFAHQAARATTPPTQFCNCMAFRYCFDPAAADPREAFTCEEIVLPDLAPLEKPGHAPQFFTLSANIFDELGFPTDPQ